MLEFELPIVQPAVRTERRDAAENRLQILKTASKLFAEQGVDQVCMSEIAKAAGVGKGTLYRRFSNKGDLCLALLDTELKQFQNKVMGALRQKYEAGQKVSERLNWFIQEAVSFTQSHLDLMVEISDIGSDNAVQDVNQPHFWMEMTVKGHLQQMAQEGTLPAGLDLDYVTAAILSPLDARILKTHLHSRNFSVQQVSSGIQSIIKHLTR